MFDSAKKKATEILEGAKSKVNEVVSYIDNEAKKFTAHVEGSKENATINWDADVDSENERQFLTLLIISVKSGTSFKIKGMNPLEYAFKNDDKYLIKLLIDYGFDVNSYKSAIVDSVERNDFKTTMLLLKAGADANVYGGTPLKKAIENKNIEMVKLLVKNKADVNGENGDPIIWATREADAEIIKFLISSGAKLEVKDQKPLKIAMEQRNIEVCKILIDAGACFETYYELDSILPNTIDEGNVEFVDFLLTTWKDLATRNVKHVLRAIENENVEIVKLFIKNGFDVTTNNNVCIITATFQRNKEMVVLLCDSGADAKVDDSLPLRNVLETYEFDTEAARYLVKKGAEPTIVLLKEVNLSKCNYFIVEGAINLGADISPIPFDTFLDLASYGKKNVIELLIERGYKYTYKDLYLYRKELKDIKDLFNRKDIYNLIIKNAKLK